MRLLSAFKRFAQQRQDDQYYPELEPETAYEMLRCPRRRQMLEYLAMDSSGPVPVSDIADHLATCYDDDRTAAYVAAIQSHLPRMAEAGVCRYDDDRKLVELTARGRAVLDVHQTVSRLLD